MRPPAYGVYAVAIALGRLVDTTRAAPQIVCSLSPVRRGGSFVVKNRRSNRTA